MVGGLQIFFNLRWLAKKNGLRYLLPYEYFEKLSTEMVVDQFRRSELATKCLAKGQKVTDGAVDIYSAEMDEMGQYSASPSTDDIVFVTNMVGGPIRRRVSFLDNSCTCYVMSQYRIPCRHFCAALAKLNRMNEVWRAFGDEYKMVNYAAVYKDRGIEIPQGAGIEYISDHSLLPSQYKPLTRGRPRSRRIRSRGESGPVSVYRRRISGFKRRARTLIVRA